MQDSQTCSASTSPSGSSNHHFTSITTSSGGHHLAKPYSLKYDSRLVSKLPPPPLISPQLNCDMSDQLNGSAFSTINPMKLPDCGLTSSHSTHPSAAPQTFMNSSSAALAAAAAAAHPGLLQMLLDAEKSQELIWSSIRYSTASGHLPPRPAPFSYLPTIGRVFEDPSAVTSSSSTSSSSPFMVSNFISGCPILSSNNSGTSLATSEANEGDGKSDLPRSLAINHLTSPIPQLIKPMINHWDSVQEITARLLFMVIGWIKSLPTFRTLTKNDKVSELLDCQKTATWCTGSSY